MESRNNSERNGKRDGNKHSNGHRTAARIFTMLSAIVIIVVAVLMRRTDSYAAQNEWQESNVSGRVRSSGRVQYEYAAIDGDDLQKIDEYISDKKNAAARVLIQLGTRFRHQSEKYVYDRNPDAGQEEVDLSGLSWSVLAQAAKESQNVPLGLSVLNPESALYIEGVDERTDFYAAATEDNLSAGKAAWVDGRLLLGNGADNDRAYRQGIKDGEQGNIPENFSAIYKVQGSSVEIRHTHIGNQANSEGTSGCYYNYLTKITEVYPCGAPLTYCDSTWYPNDNEPGGGTWHGGYYTCSGHGGIYTSPGVCTQEDIVEKAEWNHSVVCGLSNAFYARLTVREADTEKLKGQVCLSAVLEKGQEYSRLVWQKGEALVWTDSKGNVLGKGPDLMVSKPGIYRCSINVANADINQRMTSAVVTVSGLVMSGN